MSAPQIQAFFLEKSPAKLFGIFHPPTGPSRDRSVLICPPIGQEQIRSHRALRQLALRLSKAGFSVLRMDYGGTGDAPGSAADLRMKGLLIDLELGVEALKERSGHKRVSMLGCRLGGSLAALHASINPIDQLLLWEPVLDGKAFTEEMEAEQREHAAIYGRDGEMKRGEVMGFEWPAAFWEDLERLDLGNERTLKSRETLLLRQSEAEEGNPFEAAVQVHPSAPVWRKDSDLNAGMVPTATLRAIVKWFSQKST